MRTGEPFGPIVARALDVLSRALITETDDVRGRNARPRTLVVLPPHATGRGGNATLEDAAIAPTTLLVFVRDASGSGVAPPFRLRDALPVEAEPGASVAAVYRAVLGREVDPAGRAAYAPRLTSGALSVGTLVALLLASPEGRGRDARFLVIPDTSAWLAGLGVDPASLDIVDPPEDLA